MATTHQPLVSNFSCIHSIVYKVGNHGDLFKAEVKWMLMAGGRSVIFLEILAEFKGDVFLFLGGNIDPTVPPSLPCG